MTATQAAPAFPDSFVGAAFQMLLTPGTAFRGMRAEESLAPALRFAAGIGVLMGLAQGIVIALQFSGGALMLVLAILVLTPLQQLVGVFIAGGILQLVTMIFGGKDNTQTRCASFRTPW